MPNKKKQHVRMAISIACLVMISAAVGGIAANGHRGPTIVFAVVWLLVAPVLIKEIYDIKKAERDSDKSDALKV